MSLTIKDIKIKMLIVFAKKLIVAANGSLRLKNT